CPTVERVRAPLEAAFGALGVPYGLDATVRTAQTSLGRALLALLRYAWLGGAGRDCSASCAHRTPASRVPMPTSSKAGSAAVGSAPPNASRRRSSSSAASPSLPW